MLSVKRQCCFLWRVGNRTDSNGWFDDITIPLNAGLVSIIGQNDPSATLPFRHSGNAHTIIDALAFGEESRIVARCADAEAADGKVWLERKSRLRSGSRLIQRA